MTHRPVPPTSGMNTLPAKGGDAAMKPLRILWYSNAPWAST